VSLVINLTFSPNDERVVRLWWDACDRGGLPSLGATSAAESPHVTLAVIDGAEPGDVIEQLEEELYGLGGPTVLLAHFGVFVQPKLVLFLGVTPTDELRYLQREVIDTAVAAGGEVWDHYQPGTWVPHCTLARDFPSLTSLTPLLTTEPAKLPDLPLLVHTDGIEVVGLPDSDVVGYVPLL
jgi:2'-5' RNA ligase